MPLSPPSIDTGIGPRAATVSPDGRSVYEGVYAALIGYDIGLDGTLANKQGPGWPVRASCESGPMGPLAISPGGKSGYAPSCFGNIDQFDIGADGNLSFRGTTQFGRTVTGVAVSPDGTSLYVTSYLNHTDGTVSQLDIGSGGELIPKSPPTVAAGEEPARIILSPEGRNAYLVDHGLDPDDRAGASDGGVAAILQYTVGANGKLSPKAPPAVATAGDPGSIAISPDGRSVYFTADDSSGGRILQYDVGADGALHAKNPGSIAASGESAEGLAVNPDGRSVYVADYDGNAVSQYDVGADGTLSPKSPPTVATTGTNTLDVAVTPVRSGATTTGISCSPSVVAPGDATECKATVTNAAHGGQTTPTGTVGFTSSGAGSFQPSS